jgi:EmrB/QacA subfamily drug resistance transporter
MSLRISRTKLVPLIISCALFMEILDGTIISTALPSIAQALHTDPIHLNLAITAYLLSLAVFVPLSGWAADRYGARTVFRAAILIFTLSSIGCGMAQSLTQLILGRLAQGLGGAMMVPVGRLVLLRTVPKSDLVNAWAWMASPAMIGPALGPPLGGLIITYASWRWIFFVNVPIGLLGMVLVSLFIDNIREDNDEPLDLSGFFLMAATLSGLVFGFEMVGRNLLSGSIVAALLIGGGICAVLYLKHTRRVSAPIVDLAPLKIQTYRLMSAGGSMLRIGIGALPFLLPMLLQIGFGLSPLISGLLTCSIAVGSVITNLFARRFIQRFGFRKILIRCSLIGSISIMICAFFRPMTPHDVIFILLLAGGVFRMLTFTAMNTLTFADVPQALMSRATTLYSVMQQLSFSLGVGISAMVLKMTLFFKQGETLSADDFWPAFLVIGLISASCIFSFKKLKPDAGVELSGHRPLSSGPLANVDL